MLVRYDPFDEWDQFLAEVLAGVAGPRRVPIDAIRRGDRVEMSCELPGVDPATIAVTVDDDVLAIRAERVVDPEVGDEVLELERAQGVFGRDVALSPELDASRVDTRYEAGILRITIPVADVVAA
jgi:HSP20 family protein